MKLKDLGIVLIVIGVAALVLGNLTYTKTEPVAKVGPLQVQAEQEHRILNIPTVAGVVILLSGLALVIVYRRA